MALQLLWALAAFQFPDLFTVGMTPRTSDQLVAKFHYHMHKLKYKQHQTAEHQFIL
jgi:hypothetical protein